MELWSALMSRRIKPRDRDRSAETETVYHAPEKGMGRVAEYLGIAFRGFTAFCGIFGLVMLMYQAFRLYKPNGDYRYFTLSLIYIGAVCLLFALLCTVASWNRVTAFAVPIGTAGVLVLIAAIRYGNPILFAENVGRRLYNGVISSLVADRYTDLAPYLASEKYSYSEEALLKWTVIFVAAFFAVLFYFAVAKKTRIIYKKGKSA